MADRKYGLGSIVGDAYYAGFREGFAIGFKAGLAKAAAKLAMEVNIFIAAGNDELLRKVYGEDFFEKGYTVDMRSLRPSRPEYYLPNW